MSLNNILFAKYRRMNKVLKRFLEKDVFRKIKNVDYLYWYSNNKIILYGFEKKWKISIIFFFF